MTADGPKVLELESSPFPSGLSYLDGRVLAEQWDER